jgi:hypothetical protein
MGHMSLSEGRRHIDEWLTVKLKAGRCSELMRWQLAYHLVGRVYNVHTIFDEIGRLEGTDPRSSTTKAAAPLTGPLLRHLWHKHHFQARFMLPNLSAHWHRRDQQPRLQELCDAMNTDGDASRVAHELAVDGYADRCAATAITGEWIVYASIDGVNIYLTLGEHGDDPAIRARVDACAAEFPELQPLLQRQ